MDNINIVYIINLKKKKEVKAGYTNVRWNRTIGKMATGDRKNITFYSNKCVTLLKGPTAINIYALRYRAWNEERQQNWRKKHTTKKIMVRNIHSFIMLSSG